jgi:hypothetical protein
VHVLNVWVYVCVFERVWVCVVVVVVVVGMCYKIIVSKTSVN